MAAANAWRTWVVVTVHASVLLAVTLLWLPRNSGRMFNGQDGNFMRVLIEQQWAWKPFGPDLTLNWFQGLGGVVYPINMSLFAPYLWQLLWRGEVSPLLSYACFALELFLATYLWARMFQAGRKVAICAAWLLTLGALPFLGQRYGMYTIWQLVPQSVDTLFCAVVCLWLFQQIGKVRTRPGIAAAAAVCAIPIYMTASNPVFVMIHAPVLLLVGTGLLVLSDSRREVKSKVLAAAAAVGAYVASGTLHFLYGNTFYSAAGFFSGELLRNQKDLSHASVAFQGQTYLMGPCLLGLSVLGALAVALTERGSKAGRFAILHLLLTALLVGGGYLLVLQPGWRGPQGQYFEQAFWPSYATFATAAFFSVHGMAQRLAGRSVQTEGAGLGHLLPIACLPVLGLFLLVTSDPNPEKGYPPRSSAITEVLSRELRPVPGAEFKGYAANFTGTSRREGGISWLDQHVLDQHVLKPSMGNEHRFVGLGYFFIPILNDYTQYTTPPYHAFGTRLLARPEDGQLRNIVVVTVPQPHLLRALGVRFVITESTLNEGREAAHLGAADITLRLYDLGNVNRGTYSPTNPITVASASDAIAQLKRPLDLERDVVVFETIPEKLVRAVTARLYTERGGMRIAASSKGTSMLLLPVQFTHCFHPVEPAPQPYRLIRTNLVQAGIIFSGALDLRLRMSNGPFTSPGCRIRDLKDMDAINMREVGSRFPLDLKGWPQ